MAKRGRPRTKPPREKRPKAGRPPKHLHENPDRYLIAAFDVLARIMDTERGAALLLVLHLAGTEIEFDGSHLGVAISAPAMRAAKSEADRLRQLARHASTEDDLEWRKAMAAAIFAAYWSEFHSSPEGARLVVLTRAAMAGEEAFARAMLLPLIDGRAAPGAALIPPGLIRPMADLADLVRIFGEYFSHEPI